LENIVARGEKLNSRYKRLGGTGEEDNWREIHNDVIYKTKRKKRGAGKGIHPNYIKRTEARRRKEMLEHNTNGRRNI